MKYLTQRRRAYIYRCFIGIGGVAMLYGYLSDEELLVWLGLASTVLNVMPAANTSTSKPIQVGDEETPF